MVQGKITVADILTTQMGATSSGLISDPPPSSPIFMPDALPVATLPLYPGLGQAPNMLLGYFQTSAPIAAHNLTVHTAPLFVGGGEMLLGKESPSGSSHSSSAGSGSGPYQVCILLSLS